MIRATRDGEFNGKIAAKFSRGKLWIGSGAIVSGKEGVTVSSRVIADFMMPGNWMNSSRVPDSVTVQCIVCVPFTMKM
jgi:hypothetical protein